MCDGKVGEGRLRKSYAGQIGGIVRRGKRDMRRSCRVEVCGVWLPFGEIGAPSMGVYTEFRTFKQVLIAIFPARVRRVRRSDDAAPPDAPSPRQM
ncbi:hypothetical protein EVAR_57049_1 [Eumeta japonica]|uniref:Uncharacterized protein n=1 Tax=Eumeta variegata TaxID=151549 RepID=A0A4C1YS49_EUMVA|nr:hypothetical protein EVAR_57049_1 [Eumeta japonica]